MGEEPKRRDLSFSARYDGPEAISTWAMAQLELLTVMFGDVDLAALAARHPRHPALLERHWLLALTNRIPTAIELPFSPDHMPAFAEADDWIPPGPHESTAAFWEAAVPDPSARKTVTTRLHRPDQYRAVLAELKIWGRLRSSAAFDDVELREVEGEADLLIRAGGRAIAAEVKTLQPGTKPDRARTDVKDASHQIIATGASPSGVLYLIVENVENASMAVGGVREPPPDVQAVIDYVRRELGSGRSKGVSHVVVVWRSVRIVPGKSKGTLIVVWIRDHVVVEHPSPAGGDDVPAEMFAIGATFAWAVGPEKDAPTQPAPEQPLLEPLPGRPEAFTIRNRTGLQVGPSDSFSLFARVTPPDPPPLFTAVLARLGQAADVTKPRRAPLAGWGLLISPLMGGIVGIVGDGRRQALVAHRLPTGRFNACLVLDRGTHLLNLYLDANGRAPLTQPSLVVCTSTRRSWSTSRSPTSARRSSTTRVSWSGPYTIVKFVGSSPRSSSPANPARRPLVGPPRSGAGRRRRDREPGPSRRHHRRYRARYTMPKTRRPLDLAHDAPGPLVAVDAYALGGSSSARETSGGHLGGPRDT